ETVTEGDPDGAVGGSEPVKSAVPSVELLEVDLHASSAGPARHEAPAVAITEEVGLQPAGQAVFAAGAHETIGNEDEGPIGIRDLSSILPGFGLSQVLIENLPECELVEQGTDQEDRTPGPGFENVHVGGLIHEAWFPAQDTFESREERLQEILATQVGDDPLLDFAVFAIGLDDANVLIDGAAGGRDLDRADVHAVSITTACSVSKWKNEINSH